MNLSLNNPYGDVTIPRAKLHLNGDSSTVIINPMALESSYNSNSSGNPYGSFKPQAGGTPSGIPAYGEVKDGHQNASPYNQGTYTVREDEEQVSRCYACCCWCRRRRKK